MNKMYESPALELIEVGVECGFAASGGSDPFDGEWVPIVIPGQD